MTELRHPLTDRPTDRRALLRGAGLGAVALATGLSATLPQRADAAGVPGFNRPIARQEILDRAHFWVDNPRPYSMEAFDIGPEEDENILWRTDCSGFVSMALALRFDDNPTGLTTETLHPDLGYGVTEAIAKDDLTPGDILIERNGDSPSGIGHTVIFDGWVDDARENYWLMEQAGGVGTTRRQTQYPYEGMDSFHPFRCAFVTD